MKNKGTVYTFIDVLNLSTKFMSESLLYQNKITRKNIIIYRVVMKLYLVSNAPAANKCQHFIYN